LFQGEVARDGEVVRMKKKVDDEVEIYLRMGRND